MLRFGNRAPEALLPLDGGRQDNAHECIIGPPVELAFEDPRIAFEHFGPECLVEVAGVPYGQIGPAYRSLSLAQRGQNLLTYVVGPARVGSDVKEPDPINKRDAGGAVGGRVAREANDIRCRTVIRWARLRPSRASRFSSRVADYIKQRSQVCALIWLNSVIGI
jgi:hypothetical protein